MRHPGGRAARHGSRVYHGTREGDLQPRGHVRADLKRSLPRTKRPKPWSSLLVLGREGVAFPSPSSECRLGPVHLETVTAFEHTRRAARRGKTRDRSDRRRRGCVLFVDRPHLLLRQRRLRAVQRIVALWLQASSQGPSPALHVPRTLRGSTECRRQSGSAAASLPQVATTPRVAPACGWHGGKRQCGHPHLRPPG